jgi:hypothetical protein
MCVSLGMRHPEAEKGRGGCVHNFFQDRTLASNVQNDGECTSTL